MTINEELASRLMRTGMPDLPLDGTDIAMRLIVRNQPSCDFPVYRISRQSDGQIRYEAKSSLTGSLVSAVLIVRGEEFMGISWSPPENMVTTDTVELLFMPKPAHTIEGAPAVLWHSHERQYRGQIREAATGERSASCTPEDHAVAIVKAIREYVVSIVDVSIAGDTCHDRDTLVDAIRAALEGVHAPTATSEDPP